MKITFLVESRGKLSLIPHETRSISRPHRVSSVKINSEREWERYKSMNPHVIKAMTPIPHWYKNIGSDLNPNETLPDEFNPDALRLMGVLEGFVKWFDGVEVEPFQDIKWDEQFTESSVTSV
jgi:hypothetical protein